MVAAGALVAGVLTDLLGWRFAFFVPGALALAAGIAFVPLVKVAAPTRHARGGPALDATGRRVSRSIFLVIAVGTLGSDVVAAVEWVAARDSRVRESHRSADGQVVPIGQPFTVGGATLAYPGDPAGPAAETIRCRCAVAFLTPDEVEQ